MCARHVNYYETLGIPRNASQQDIARAFKKLAMKYHPDKNPDSTSMYLRIDEAYKTLSDPVKRAEYDERMFGAGATGATLGPASRYAREATPWERQQRSFYQQNQEYAYSRAYSAYTSAYASAYASPGAYAAYYPSSHRPSASSATTSTTSSWTDPAFLQTLFFLAAALLIWWSLAISSEPPEDTTESPEDLPPPPSPVFLRTLTLSHWGAQLQDRDFVDILSNMSAGERAGVEELSLRGCSSLSDIALSYLRRLPNLLRLDVSFVPGFSPDKFATIIQRGFLSRLESLNIVHCPALSSSPLFLDSLKLLPRLHELNVDHIAEEHLDHLTALSALQALHFACPSDLRHQLSDSALSRLEPLATSLTSLSLTCSPRVTNRALEHLRAFPKLRNLSLRQTAVDDAGLQAALPVGLRVLDVGYCAVTDAAMEALGRHENLAELDLQGTLVSNRGIEALHASPLAARLRRLNLSNCEHITADVLALLPHFPSLSLLKIAGNRVSRDQVLQARKAFEQAHPGQRLSIVFTGTEVVRRPRPRLVPPASPSAEGAPPQGSSVHTSLPS